MELIRSFFLVLGAVAAFHATSAWSEEVIDGQVASVTDGDTIKVTPRSGGKDLKIRLVAIDTAETHLYVNGRNYSQGYWGDMGSQALEQLIPVGTQVQVISFGQDSYGRVLGTIVSGGQDVNLRMVQIGWASLYEICSGQDCDSTFITRHRVQDYVNACAYARSRGLGIFDPQRPLTEMPFEFRARIQGHRQTRYVGDLTTGLYYSPDQYQRVDLCARVFFGSVRDAQNLGFKPGR